MGLLLASFLFIVCWGVKLATRLQSATRNEKVHSVFKCFDCGSNKLNLKMPHGIFQSPHSHSLPFRNILKIQIRVHVRVFILSFWFCRYGWTAFPFAWIMCESNLKQFSLRLRPFKLKSRQHMCLFIAITIQPIWLNFISSKTPSAM